MRLSATTSRVAPLRHRRLGLLLGVGLVVPLHPLDRLLGQSSGTSLALEAAWAAVLLGAALLQDPRSSHLADPAALAAGLATGLLFPAIVGVTGGSASPSFFYLLAIPLSALVLLPELPAVAALTAVGTLGGGIVLLAREGRGWAYIAAWSYLGLAAGLLTGMGAWRYLRLWRAEAGAERARADAEERRAATALALVESERRQEQLLAVAHREATRSRDDLRQILESIPDMVIMTRLDGSIVFVNGSGQRMLGIAPGSPISTRSVFDRIVPEDHPILLRRREAFAAGLDPGTDEVRFDAGSRRRECEISGLRVDLDGQPVIVTVVRDVTERRERERKLALTERLASLGTLAAGVAHEINNPLSSILSNVRYLSGEVAELQGDPARLDEARKVARETVEGAERVGRILRDLDALTRSGERRERIAIHRVLDLAIDAAASQLPGRARVVRDYGRPPPVLGDESLLGRLALHLLLDAAQAVPDDAWEVHELCVATRTDPTGRAVIEVGVRGDGLPPEPQDRPLQPRAAAGPAGVAPGLGLSLCQGIASALGGELVVEGEVGRGSTFRVTLPAMPMAPP